MNLPVWLKTKRTPLGKSMAVNGILKRHKLHTVCQSAKCPNIFECFAKGTATFLILGNVCTRHCRFCAMPNNPAALAGTADNEALRVAQACQEMKLKHIVITSVTRDDLADGGASVFQDTILAVRRLAPEVIIEVLTPDFEGERNSIKQVALAQPHVFNHNIETVWRLYSDIRPEADYLRSLQLLAYVKKLDARIVTKSGLMLGLGETNDEVIETFRHLRKAGCEALTIGQYLRPTRGQQTVPVQRFVPPDEFEALRQKGYELGFRTVAAGPYVRSSYGAQELFMDLRKGVKMANPLQASS